MDHLGMNTGGNLGGNWQPVCGSDARQATRCARPPRFRWPGRTR